MTDTQEYVNPWTDEAVAMLKDLWAKGESAAAVAHAIGNVSRNAVIGKVHRLGLQLRGIPSGRRVKFKAPLVKIKPKPKPRPAPAPMFSAEPLPVEAPPPDPSKLVSLLDLEEHHCRYPHTIDGKHLFCGCTKAPGISYCASHAVLCFDMSRPNGRRSNPNKPQRVKYWADTRELELVE